MATDPVILVGNPNVGKSVIFGLLTRSYATVSNYPGTTVELTAGRGLAIPGKPEVVDTPGTNSLTPLSEDERVTRDLILDTPAGRVLQVGDTKNLRRALLLSLELAEMEVPHALVLNMKDEADALGMTVDTGRLSQLLGVPVVSAVAIRGEGADRILKALQGSVKGRARLPLPADLDRAVGRIAAELPEETRGRNGLATMMLAGDDDLVRRFEPVMKPGAIERIEEVRRSLTGGAGTIASRLTRARLKAADRLVAECAGRPSVKTAPGRRIGELTTHPVWGIPVVLFVLWATYEIVGVFGAGTAVNFLEHTVFGKLINPAAARAASIIPWPLVRDLLVGQYGVITMALTYAIAIVLPIVFFFFLIFGLLEDSGYLPRLAVMLNRVMKMMGLNGKAVLPMVLGLGCDTMATLTARILESKKEKVLVTLLLALGVPCSAQLAVILALTSYVSVWAAVIWAAVVASTLFLVGWAASRVIPGEESEFILELPPLRVPTLGNILNKTLARMEWYLKEAVPLFILGTLMLFFMDRFGALKVMEKAAAPVVVHLLSLPPQTASAFVVGFLRRDYGAVFLVDAARSGQLSGIQIVVALVTLTLFVPCVANFFIMIRERGVKTALAMVAFIFPFAFLAGGLVNWVLRASGVRL